MLHFFTKNIKILIAFFVIVPSAAYAQQLSLKGALLSARANNALLKVENYNIGLSESDIITAAIKPNPVFNNQTIVLGSSKYFPGNTNLYSGQNRQVWFQMTKRFQVAGQRNSKIDFAQRAYELSKFAYSEVERNLFYDVSVKWLDVWYSNMNYVLATRAASNMDSLVKINQIRLRNQVITGSDLLRTRILAEQYMVVRKKEEQNYLFQLQNLKFVTGGAEIRSIDFNDSFVSILPLCTISSLNLTMYNP